MAIWEPCNYVSNLAYDRLVVEICNQKDWALGEVDIQRIAEAFAIGSSNTLSHHHYHKNFFLLSYLWIQLHAW